MGVRRLELVRRGTYDEEQLVLQMSVVQHGRLLAHTPFPAVGTLYTNVHLHTHTNHQLTGVKQVIEVQYSDGYCGGVSATQTLFWDERQLYQLELLSNGLRDTEFERSYYRYPNEHTYDNNVVVLQQEAGRYENRQRVQYTRQIEQLYRWTGQQLLPIKH